MINEGAEVTIEVTRREANRDALLLLLFAAAWSTKSVRFPQSVPDDYSTWI